MYRRTWLTVWSCVMLLALPLSGQTTASLTVRVLSPDGTRIGDAQVLLENPVSGFRSALVGDGAGEFHLAQIPLQSYRLTVTAPGFAAQTMSVSLRSNVPTSLDVILKLAAEHQEVNVEAVETGLVDTEATGTRNGLSGKALETIPVPPGNRGLEAFLLTLPGVAVNANGAIHPRGAHNQMTFVVDGLPISDQMSGAFATALDPNIVSSLEFYTGDVPAEFGAKVSGVAAISTKSGIGSRRRSFGSVQLGGGSFDTLQSAVQTGGELGRFAYFASVSAVKSHRFLDAVSLDNLHNGGNSERVFIRLDYTPSDRDGLRLEAMAGRSDFELANRRSQQAAGMKQRQLLRDASFWLTWNRTLSPSATWEWRVAYRPTIAQLSPSAGDTPVTAAQSRHLNTFTVSNRVNWVRGRNSLRAGVDWQRFHVSEDFAMGITDPAFNVPGAKGFNDSLLAHDLSRGGSLFRFRDRAAGTLFSLFAQDVIRAGRLTLSLGARYDNYRFLVNGQQVQPRVGVAFDLKETGTVLRASYNRNYQTPPNENLLLSDSKAASQLAPSAVRQALGSHVPIQPQREDVREVGLQQRLFGRMSLNASYYRKSSRDQQDNNNFFDTGIIFPVTLARIRVEGAEARLVLPPVRGLSASVSATHARAVSTPPFTGGLYIGQQAVELLNAGPFLIDHDQKLGLQSNIHYTPHRRWWVSTSIRYDSGLVSNPSDPVKVAADPDHSDLLPYVNLTASTPRVRPRTVTDVAVGYQGWRGDRQAWDVQLHASNIFNVTALYNFQSVFVGTRLITPRMTAVKLRWNW